MTFPGRPTSVTRRVQSLILIVSHASPPILRLPRCHTSIPFPQRTSLSFCHAPTPTVEDTRIAQDTSTDIENARHPVHVAPVAHGPTLGLGHIAIRKGFQCILYRLIQVTFRMFSLSPFALDICSPSYACLFYPRLLPTNIAASSSLSCSLLHTLQPFSKILFRFGHHSPCHHRRATAVAFPFPPSTQLACSVIIYEPPSLAFAKAGNRNPPLCISPSRVLVRLAPSLASSSLRLPFACSRTLRIVASALFSSSFLL